LASSQALIASLALALAGTSALAAPPAAAPAGAAASIYTCTDAKGRTLTADRPIPDCIDREQRELNPSGTTRRKVEPTYSAREQAEREDREREKQIQAARAQDERRRERALIVRYPTAVAHDRERGEALDQIDAVIHAAKKRLSELSDDRRKIDDELEFYKKDPAKVPDSLRRRADDNDKSVAVQNRFIGEQEEEKKRVNARFDEERARLKPLWNANASAQQPPQQQQR